MTSTEAVNETAVGFEHLEEFLPTLSQFGGDVQRLLVVPQDQLQSLAVVANKCGLSESTTFVPSSISRHAYVFTDATNLNLSRLMGALCRPCYKTFQLAERLLTRVDIEWPNVGNLLLNNQEANSVVAPAPLQPLSEGFDLQGTQQIGSA